VITNEQIANVFHGHAMQPSQPEAIDIRGDIDLKVNRHVDPVHGSSGEERDVFKRSPSSI
jgi:hypothetical protein